MEGCGPSVGELRERVNEREEAAAHQSGSDLLRYGASVIDEPGLRLVDSGCKPSSRKTKNLFPTRYAQAMKAKKEMRIRGMKRTSSTTKTFNVANSERGTGSYVVTIATTPSCTCKDFRQNKSRVVCKHIIFVVLVVLDEPGLKDVLITRYMSLEDTTKLIAKTDNEVILFSYET